MLVKYFDHVVCPLLGLSDVFHVGDTQLGHTFVNAAMSFDSALRNLSELLQRYSSVDRVPYCVCLRQVSY